MGFKVLWGLGLGQFGRLKGQNLWPRVCCLEVPGAHSLRSSFTVEQVRAKQSWGVGASANL